MHRPCSLLTGVGPTMPILKCIMCLGPKALPAATLGWPPPELYGCTGDTPHHSLLNVWRLHGHTRIGDDDLQDLPLRMIFTFDSASI